MNYCIEAQWRLYIGYMRETLDYTITIRLLTIISLTFRSPILAFHFPLNFNSYYILQVV
jgi:hypothetical protein